MVKFPLLLAAIARGTRKGGQSYATKTCSFKHAIENESIQYLKTNSATNKAELRDLKDSLGLSNIDE